MNEAPRPEFAANDESAEECRLKPAPLAAEDFYMENGLLVFTEAYHLKRGYCCNSECRHCPYR